MRPFLVEQLRAPATDRLAAAFAGYDLMDSGGRALDACDRWIGMLDDDATPRRARRGATGDRRWLGRLCARATQRP